MPIHSGVYRFAARYKLPFVFDKIYTVPKVLTWTPSACVWGATALGAVLFFGDSIPLYRQGVLEKAPLIGWYYDDTIDPQDTPFS